MSPRDLPRPKETRCERCGSCYAEVICHICKTPKREWDLMKQAEIAAKNWNAMPVWMKVKQ